MQFALKWLHEEIANKDVLVSLHRNVQFALKDHLRGFSRQCTVRFTSQKCEVCIERDIRRKYEQQVSTHSNSHS